MAKRNPFSRFFGVWLRGQTYLNLIYLILAFPLGLAYFIFFAVGIPLGLGLSIVLVGFAILAFVALGWWVFASFERLLAIWLLRVPIAPMDKPGAEPVGIWERFTTLLTNPVTWKSLLYLAVKLPLGILSFILLVLLGGISLALLVSPLTFFWLPITIEFTGQSSWVLDTALEALVGFLLGALLATISLHVFNYLAYISALWAQLMLGNPRPQAGAAHPAVASDQWPVAVLPPAELPAQPEAVFTPGPGLDQVPEYPLGEPEEPASVVIEESPTEPASEPAAENLPETESQPETENNPREPKADDLSWLDGK
jgi:hypothetical protein